MSVGVYGPQKLIHHLPVIQKIGKEPAAPVHIHLIVSDLCNQSCFVSGTMVSCPNGRRPIESLAVGDMVITPNGEEHTIERHGSRRVPYTIRITADGHSVECSGNHRFLTERGWVSAETLRPGDRTYMRVRTAEESPLSDSEGIEPHLEGVCVEGIELEWSVALRPIDSVCRIEGTKTVWNFEVPPVHAYDANAFVVANCSFCAYRDEEYPSNQLFGIGEGSARNNNPNRMIPGPKVLEILSDAYEMGVKAIQFTGGGEPTLHPDFNSFLDFCHGRLDIGIVSNGVRWSAETVEHGRRAMWVRISIDAGTAETYSGIRKVSVKHFESACQTVQKLAGGSATVGVGFVVTKENWREIVEGVKLAKDLGANNVRLSAVFQSEDERYFEGFYEEASELCRAAKEEHDGDGFTVFNNFGRRLSDLQEKAPDYSLCGFHHLTTYIGGDQNMYRCCVTAYNELGLLGSLKDRRFKEAWFSRDVQEKINSFDAHSCQRCMYNEQNRYIIYAMQDTPAHSNFV